MTNRCVKCGCFVRTGEVCSSCGYRASDEPKSINTNENSGGKNMTETWNGEHDNCVRIVLFGDKEVYLDPKTITKDLIQSLARRNQKGSYDVLKDGVLIGPSELSELQAGDVVEIKSYTKPGV